MHKIEQMMNQSLMRIIISISLMEFGCQKLVSGFCVNSVSTTTTTFRLYSSKQDETPNPNCTPKKTIIISKSGPTSQNGEQAPKEDDISRRFKFTVNALMGAFDPMDVGENNTERDEGNILNAMMTFPTIYTFSAVGRTNGDAIQQETYATDVTNTIMNLTLGDADKLQWRIKPRGAKFTRVDVSVLVDSPQTVTNVYKALDEISATVMKY